MKRKEMEIVKIKAGLFLLNKKIIAGIMKQYNEALDHNAYRHIHDKITITYCLNKLFSLHKINIDKIANESASIKYIVSPSRIIAKILLLKALKKIVTTISHQHFDRIFQKILLSNISFIYKPVYQNKK
tara:strand:- start:2 stop:388 length:387 start_codon:yes stop_codon:yes gene_type:complete